MASQGIRSTGSEVVGLIGFIANRRRARLLAGQETLGRWRVSAEEWGGFISDEIIAAVDPESRGNLLAHGPPLEGQVEVVVGPRAVQVGRRFFDLGRRGGPVVLGVSDVLGPRKVMEIRLGFRSSQGAAPVGALRFPYPAGQERVIVEMRKVHQDRGWGNEAYLRPIDRHALLLFRIWLAVVIGGALLLTAGLLLRESEGVLAVTALVVAVVGGTLSVMLLFGLGPHLLSVAPEIRRQGRESAARRSRRGGGRG